MCTHANDRGRGESEGEGERKQEKETKVHEDENRRGRNVIEFKKQHQTTLYVAMKDGRL